METWPLSAADSWRKHSAGEQVATMSFDKLVQCGSDMLAAEGRRARIILVAPRNRSTLSRNA